MRHYTIFSFPSIMGWLVGISSHNKCGRRNYNWTRSGGCCSEAGKNTRKDRSGNDRCNLNGSRSSKFEIHLNAKIIYY